MNLQITSTGAALKATWANVPSIASTSQSEAPLALANMLYCTKTLAASFGPERRNMQVPGDRA